MDEGLEPSYLGHEPNMLTIYINPQITLNIKYLILDSLVQVSHLLLPITKRVHCFYANQAFLP